jgi:hypothetical protein
MTITIEYSLQTSHANDEYLHVVATDVTSGEVTDFEIVALPLPDGAIEKALDALHERHLRCAAAARREEMIARLRTIEPRLAISPYRDAEPSTTSKASRRAAGR